MNLSTDLGFDVCCVLFMKVNDILCYYWFNIRCTGYAVLNACVICEKWNKNNLEGKGSDLF